MEEERVFGFRLVFVVFDSRCNKLGTVDLTHAAKEQGILDNLGITQGYYRPYATSVASLWWRFKIVVGETSHCRWMDVS